MTVGRCPEVWQSSCIVARQHGRVVAPWQQPQRFLPAHSGGARRIHLTPACSLA